MTRLQVGLLPPIPAGLPFRVEEYRTRHERVRADMAACGMDLLYVTSPANLFYLTGYEST
jgi:Xaa-Pro aminopeptidase